MADFENIIGNKVCSKRIYCNDCKRSLNFDQGFIKKRSFVFDHPFIK